MWNRQTIRIFFKNAACAHLNSCWIQHMLKTNSNNCTEPSRALPLTCLCISLKENADAEWHCKNEQQQRHSLPLTANSAGETRTQKINKQINYCSPARCSQENWNQLFTHDCSRLCICRKFNWFFWRNIYNKNVLCAVRAICYWLVLVHTFSALVDAWVKHKPTQMEINLQRF